jgi:hypothetical protein
MSTLARRLRKLETGLTDRSGLIPHSARWFAYWNAWIDKLRGKDPRGLIPSEAAGAILLRQATTDGPDTYR